MYTKEDLDRHMKQGDLVGPLAESGFKGHPKCKVRDGKNPTLFSFVVLNPSRILVLSAALSSLAKVEALRGCHGSSNGNVYLYES